jgi:hypothetical protein
MQMEEDLVWIQTTWCRASMHNKSVVKTFYNRDIVLDGYSEVQDDGLLIHDKLS